MRSSPALAGALAVVFGAPLASAEPFTLVVMPDTQTESTNTPQVRFPAMTQWIADNERARSIRFVAHVGDLVNWDTPFSTPPHFQYVNASDAMATLDTAGIPYAIAIGNHDTAAVGGVSPDGGACYCGGSAAPGDVRANLRNTQTFNQFFPLARFAARRGQYEPGKIDNSYHTFSAGGVDWLVLSSELDPRPGALAWFNEVVSNHPDHNVIYVTHNYLAPSGNLAGGVGYGNSTPQAVWDGLIKLHANIRFVLSGHLTQTAIRQTAGNSGATVYQLLTDYQDEGNGWLRTLEIDPAAETVKSEVYSPHLKQFKTGSTERFTWTGVKLIPARRPPDAGAGGNDAGGSGNGGSAGSGTSGSSGSGGDGNRDAGGAGTSHDAGLAGRGGGGASGSGARPDASAGMGSRDDSPVESDCGCRLAGSDRGVWAWAFVPLVLGVFRRRRHMKPRAH